MARNWRISAEVLVKLPVGTDQRTAQNALSSFVSWVNNLAYNGDLGRVASLPSGTTIGIEGVSLGKESDRED